MPKISLKVTKNKEYIAVITVTAISVGNIAITPICYFWKSDSNAPCVIPIIKNVAFPYNFQKYIKLLKLTFDLNWTTLFI